MISRAHTSAQPDFSDTSRALSELYETDETAWLEAMAELIREGRLQELDHEHLREYLSDMARRDKREVLSRLAVLVAHRLKWTHQPSERTRSWRTTVETQRQELEDLLQSAVLRAYAVESLPTAYERGIRQALRDTDLPESTFPEQSPFTLADLLSEDWDRE